MTAASFAGRVVLVTGGARGVGRFVTEEFAVRGAHVIVNCFHSEPDARRLVDELAGSGLSAEFIKASVAKPGEVDRMMERVREEHGGLDVLVNNAARGVFLPLGELTEDDWRRAFDLNLHAVRHCSLAALPLLARRAGSSVVNLSSHGARHTVPNYGLVGTTKAAMEGLSRYLAVEFAPYGVRVNVAGCQVMDNRVGDMFPDAARMKSATRDATPWGRLPTERDLARLAVLLASEEAGFVTGQTLLADGGLSCGAALHGPPARPSGTPHAAGDTESADVVQLTGSHPAVDPTTLTDATDLATATALRHVPAPRKDPDPIVVTGIGLLLPGAESPARFWELLGEGTPQFTDQSRRYPMEHFLSPDPATADSTYTAVSGIIDHPRLHPRAQDIAGATPVERWIRHTVAQALDGRTPTASDRMSLYVGGWADGTREMEEGALRELLSREAADAGLEPGAVAELLSAALPGAVPEPGAFGPAGLVRRALRGLVPDRAGCLNVDAACSSGLYAVDLAARSLRSGDTDVALALGLSMCTIRYQVLFSKLTGLSRTGEVRAFDEKADGTLFSDAVAAVVLRRRSDAERDGDTVLAFLDGFGASSDGRGKALHAPRAEGQRLAIRRAYADGGPHGVRWVVGHGTGTPLGDSTELDVLSGEFASGVHCTGNKSLFGHGAWTSGLVSVIHAVLGLRHGTIPAQARYDGPRGGTVDIPTRPVPFSPGAVRRVGVSAFGFGGTNAHLILSDRPGTPTAPSASPSPLVLVGWSALLPDSSDSASALAALHSGDHPPTFGAAYPPPPFSTVRLPPPSVRAVDRTQLMALQLMERLGTDHGRFWEDVADRTCVIAAHSGPTRLSQELSVRCFASALDSAAGTTSRTARWWRTYRTELSARVAEVGPDSLPGILPNVVAGRIAGRHDLHGPALAVDTGRTSGRDAYAVAARYLRDGDCDLALLVAAHGNTLPASGALFGVADDAVREGAFLLALATAEQAAERGWPVLAELPDVLPATPPDPNRCFGGADDIVVLLRRLALQKQPVGERPQLMRFEVTADPVRHGAEEHPAVAPLPDGCLVIVDDAALAKSLAGAVRAAGATLVVMDARSKVGEEYVAGLVRDCGRPAHLRVFVSPARTAWPSRPRPALLAAQEAAFLALRELPAGGSAVVCLLDPQAGGVAHPHGALFTGMLKSALWDLPDVWLHALTTDAPLPEALGQIEEASRHRPEIPVSFLRHGVRHTETLSPADITPDGPPLLDDDSVVVAVGGARGITASILLRLVRRHRCHLWLIGSSGLDAVPPEIRAESDEEFAGRRRSFIADLLGTGATPGEAVRRYDVLASAREAARTVDRLGALCGEGRVHYLRADVTDPGQVSAAARRIAAEHPRIDLLVNAAGVHRGGDLATKSLSEFRRIRDVKLLGYHCLRDAFDSVPVRQWCNFGSLTGVLGLPGEIDYAAANDLLGAAARAGSHTDRTEFTVAWTLWSQSGMATRDLVGDAVKRRGHLSQVSDEEGAQHFLSLLRLPQRWLPGVVQLGSTERRFIADRMPRLAAAGTGAFLGVPRLYGTGVAEWDLTFTDRQVRLVSEHPVTGLPTLPGTLVLALLAEAAAALVPGARPDVVRDVRYHRFIRVRPDSRVRHRVRAELTGPGTVRVTVTSTTSAPDGRVLSRDALHTEAVVDLDAHPEAQAPPALTEGTAAYDPYYEPDSPIPLRGSFVNTTDHRFTSDGGRSLWRPRTAPDALFYGRMLVPALLVDALARTHALRPAGASGTPVSAPTGLGRLEIYRHGDDLSHFVRHPDGIQLVEDRALGRFHALTLAGEPVLSFTGMRILSVGTVDIPGTAPSPKNPPTEETRTR
ncbi:SDR family oxidoreductase [Streptomyces acidiscabies]|uniref:SDR family oxidoreductase n=1 Tax=Streptomyces acidiscabies TaxID=42234 RepID=UPI00067D0304|nr:SDR family oxidoreductase [Streptomyces acidiscabies]